MYYSNKKTKHFTSSENKKITFAKMSFGYKKVYISILRVLLKQYMSAISSEKFQST